MFAHYLPNITLHVKEHSKNGCSRKNAFEPTLSTELKKTKMTMVIKRKREIGYLVIQYCMIYIYILLRRQMCGVGTIELGNEIGKFHVMGGGITGLEEM